MEFSRQECWSGLPFPSLGDLPDSGIEPRSPALQAGPAAREAVEVQSPNYWAAREFMACGHFQSRRAMTWMEQQSLRRGASSITGTEPAVMATGTILGVQ